MSGIEPLVVGVGALSEVVKGVGSVIDRIQSGRHADNEEARNALAGQVSELEASLKQVGELAGVAESYGRALEDVLELLWLSERAQQVVEEQIQDGVSGSGSPGQETGWAVFNDLWSRIDRGRDPVRKSTMGLSNWFDGNDAGQMTGIFKRFDQHYFSASAFARGKQSAPLADQLRAMVIELRDAVTLLRNTLYDRILRTLQTLRGRG